MQDNEDSGERKEETRAIRVVQNNNELMPLCI